MLAEQAAHYLRKIYYGTSSAYQFRGVNILYKAVRKRFVGTRKLDIIEWLQNQPLYSQFYPIGRHKPKEFKKSRPWSAFSHLQFDLAEMQSLATRNGNVNYLAVCVDELTEYVIVKPLKNKTAQAVVSVFTEIFQTFHPSFLICDAGAENRSALMQNLAKENNVQIVIAKSKAFLAECFIRIVKSRIYKTMSFNKTLRYIDHLSEICNAINHSPKRSLLNHSSLEVVHNAELQQQLLTRRMTDNGKDKRSKFKKGDFVRLHFARMFAKGYRPTASEEIYQIEDVTKDYPHLYKLKSTTTDDLLKGVHYGNMLVKCSHTAVSNILTKFPKLNRRPI